MKENNPNGVRHRKGTFGCGLALIVSAVLLSYSNGLTGEFVFDDHHAVVNNPSIRKLWPLTHAMGAPQNLPTSGRPLVNLSLAINFAIGGLKPWGYHLFNVGLHAVNAALLFALIWRELKYDRVMGCDRALAGWSALGISILWAVHPIQTESVSYVTQRSELMMGFCFLATLYAARRVWDAEDQRERIAWQTLAVLMCGLGMGCKEVMVMAPCVVILYDTLLLRQPFLRLLKLRWPLYLGLFLSWGILAALLGSQPRGKSVGFGLGISWYDYLTTQFWGIGQYLRLSIWPSRLCADYGLSTVTELSDWGPPLVALLIMLGGTICGAIRWPALGFCGGTFFLILAPTSSFVPIVSEPIAERRMYLPLAALLMLVVLGLQRAVCIGFTTKRNRQEECNTSQKSLLIGLFVLMGLSLAFSTYRRNEVFRTELRFWSDVIEKRPGNQRAYCSLGIVHQQAGRLSLARENFQRAIELAPAYTDAHYNLAVCFAEIGQVESAISHFQQAAALDPSNADIFFNLGACFARAGQLESALAEYGRAIERRPSFSEAYRNRGEIYWAMGKAEEAIAEYTRSASLQPERAEVWFVLGKIFASLSRFTEARECFEKVLQLQPTSAEASNALRLLPISRG